jgi:predicted dehydrogenase
MGGTLVVKVGLLGAGLISNVHPDILPRQESACISAVVHGDGERAAALVARTGAAVRCAGQSSILIWSVDTLGCLR